MVVRARFVVGDENHGVVVKNDAISSSNSLESSLSEDMVGVDATDQGADSAAAVDEVAAAVVVKRGASMRRSVPHFLDRKSVV